MGQLSSRECIWLYKIGEVDSAFQELDSALISIGYVRVDTKATESPSRREYDHNVAPQDCYVTLDAIAPGQFLIQLYTTGNSDAGLEAALATCAALERLGASLYRSTTPESRNKSRNNAGEKRA